MGWNTYISDRERSYPVKILLEFVKTTRVSGLSGLLCKEFQQVGKSDTCSKGEGAG